MLWMAKTYWSFICNVQALVGKEVIVFYVPASGWLWKAYKIHRAILSAFVSELLFGKYPLFQYLTWQERNIQGTWQTSPNTTPALRTTLQLAKFLTHTNPKWGLLYWWIQLSVQWLLLECTSKHIGKKYLRLATFPILIFWLYIKTL